MANVDPYVQQIRSAVYGEQVRESIARSIEEMNQDNIDTQEHYDTTIASANAAITNANNAATGATNIKNEVERKLADGDFDGPQGPQGDAASIRVGTVQTGEPGTAAQVNNSGTDEDAVLNFIIPRGATGNIENIETVQITFPIDSTYQNIASGMTLTQLFSRIQLLLNAIMLTDEQLTALETKLGNVSGLYDILDKMTDIDSQEIPITVSNISANYTLYKTAQVASLSFLFGNGTAFSSLTGSDTIGTLPEGYRPKGGRYFSVVAKDAGAWGTAKYYDAVIAIDQNGVISLRGNATELKTCKYLMASLVWML